MPRAGLWLKLNCFIKNSPTTISIFLGETALYRKVKSTLTHTPLQASTNSATQQALNQCHHR